MVVITIFKEKKNKYTVYCMLHWNDFKTATEYFTHLHYTAFVCAMNICLDWCVTMFNKIDQCFFFPFGIKEM